MRPQAIDAGAQVDDAGRRVQEMRIAIEILPICRHARIRPRKTLDREDRGRRFQIKRYTRTFFPKDLGLFRAEGLDVLLDLMTLLVVGPDLTIVSQPPQTEHVPVFIPMIIDERSRQRDLAAVLRIKRDNLFRLLNYACEAMSSSRRKMTRRFIVR